MELENLCMGRDMWGQCRPSQNIRVCTICNSANSCIDPIALINPVALRKAKIVYNFGLSECNRVKQMNLS